MTSGRDRRTFRIVRLALLVLVAVVMAACGGDEIGPTVEATSSFPYRGPDRELSDAEASEALGALAGSEIACESPGSSLEADAVVGVTIRNGSMELEDDEVLAGTVRFDVTNAGDEPHELLIVFGADPGQLPLQEEGGIDESAIDENTVRGALSLFPAGTTCSGTFDLPPGEYTILCNAVEPRDGVNESHFESGEFAQLVVTDVFGDEE